MYIVSSPLQFSSIPSQIDIPTMDSLSLSNIRVIAKHSQKIGQPESWPVFNAAIDETIPAMHLDHSEVHTSHHIDHPKLDKCMERNGLAWNFCYESISEAANRTLISLPKRLSSTLATIISLRLKRESLF